MPRPTPDPAAPSRASAPPRPRRPLVAGLLVAALVAAYLGLWELLTEPPACDTESWGCLTAALAMMVVGTPVALGLAIPVLRAAGAASGLLGAVVLALALLSLPTLLEPLGPPPLAWPLVLGAVAAAYVVVEGRLVGATPRR